MRSWYPLPVSMLDMPALLGEHRELHCMYVVITQNKKGYSKHPETLRWKNHLSAMSQRHNDIVEEINKRKKGLVHPHKTPIIEKGPLVWPELIEPLEEMKGSLLQKIEGRLK